MMAHLDDNAGMRSLFLLVLSALAVRAENVENFAWMAGCWSMTRGANTVIEEHWSKPAAGVMIGYSRTLRGGRMVEAEYMRLEHADGAVRYMARITPKDGGTPFTLSKSADGEAAFSNPAHDFPQVIRYRRVSKDEMFARVENLAGTKGQDFPYKRTTCE